MLDIEKGTKPVAVSSPWNLVDSHPRLLGDSPTQARLVMSVVCRLPSNGRPFADIARGKGCGISRAGEDLIREAIL